MEFAYSIELSASQESIAVGDLGALMAKTMHPEGWEFWQDRGPLFDRLVSRVRNKVSVEFSGEAAAAREVISALKSCNDPKLMKAISQLSGNHFYQVYLAAAHSRLLHQAIAAGQLRTIEHNPTGSVAFNPLAEVGGVINSSDRISVSELAKYLKRFHTGLKRVSDVGSVGAVTPLGPKKQAESVNEVRGRLILKQLEILGHDPMNMEYEKGVRAPGIKSEVQAKIWQLQPREFAHSTKGFDEKSYRQAFKHAWDWLREEGLIVHLPAGKK